MAKDSKRHKYLVCIFMADKRTKMELRLNKMKVTDGEAVNYFIKNQDDYLRLNDFLGKPLRLRFTGKITCIYCDKPIKKTFGQGFCYDCFSTAPEAAECIIRPELCKAHLGLGRNIQWEEEHHLQPHVVYLANTGAIKVGVTRSTQVPTRWIDQGAASAIFFGVVPYRQLAGVIELEIKQFISDKTDWRKMLTARAQDIDLIGQKTMLSHLLSSHLEQYLSPDDTVYTFNYPVLEYPEKVSGLQLDKTSELHLPLLGIKGQYLLFEGGQVLNVRNHSGYWVEVSV
jgi:hypothetical protein